MDNEARVRDLVMARGRELGESRGWKKQVAGELGITPEHLSRILSGRRVSLQTVRAAEALSRSPADSPPPHPRRSVPEPSAIAAISALDRAAWERVRAWADGYFGAE